MNVTGPTQGISAHFSGSGPQQANGLGRGFPTAAEDTAQFRFQEQKPSLRFGSVMAIPDSEIQDSNNQLKLLIVQLAQALTAGAVQVVSVPDKFQFLNSKGLNIWPPDSRDKILDASEIIQVGNDPDNLYLILRPAGKPSPVFSVYGLKDNLRLSSSIRANSVGDALNVYYDIAGANTPQTGGTDDQGFFQPPVSYSSIDPAIFDEARKIQTILENNNL